MPAERGRVQDPDARSPKPLGGVPPKTQEPPPRARGPVLLGDVHSSGEPYSSIDDQDLPVVPEELAPEVREDGMKQPHLATARAHFPPEARPGPERSESIRQDPNRNTARRSLAEERKHLPAGRVVLAYVGLEENLLGRALDRAPHELKGFLTAVEDRDLVPAVKRRLIDPPEKRLERRVPDAPRQA